MPATEEEDEVEESVAAILSKIDQEIALQGATDGEQEEDDLSIDDDSLDELPDASTTSESEEEPEDKWSRSEKSPSQQQQQRHKITDDDSVDEILNGIDKAVTQESDADEVPIDDDEEVDDGISIDDDDVSHSSLPDDEGESHDDGQEEPPILEEESSDGKDNPKERRIVTPTRVENNNQRLKITDDDSVDAILDSINKQVGSAAAAAAVEDEMSIDDDSLSNLPDTSESEGLRSEDPGHVKSRAESTLTASKVQPKGENASAFAPNFVTGSSQQSANVEKTSSRYKVVTDDDSVEAILNTIDKEVQGIEMADAVEVGDDFSIDDSVSEEVEDDTAEEDGSFSSTSTNKEESPKKKTQPVSSKTDVIGLKEETTPTANLIPPPERQQNTRYRPDKTAPRSSRDWELLVAMKERMKESSSPKKVRRAAKKGGVGENHSPLGEGASTSADEGNTPADTSRNAREEKRKGRPSIFRFLSLRKKSKKHQAESQPSEEASTHIH